MSSSSFKCGGTTLTGAACQNTVVQRGSACGRCRGMVARSGTNTVDVSRIPKIGGSVPSTVRPDDEPEGRYARKYGATYDRSLTVKEISSKVRGHIKEAVKAGDLPSDWKYSVVTRNHSAVDVTIDTGTEPSRIVANDMLWIKEPTPVSVPTSATYRREGRMFHEYEAQPGDRVEVRPEDNMTEKARTTSAAVQEMLNGYNHDGSDVMTDYHDRNFYGFVKFESPEPQRTFTNFREFSADFGS